MLNFLINEPVQFLDICYIFPPTLRQFYCSTKAGIYANILTTKAEDLFDEFAAKLEGSQKVPTPFEFLLANCYTSQEFLKTVEDAFFFFTHEKILVLYDEKKILIGSLNEHTKLEDLRFIDEMNYFTFQNLVRQSIGENPIEQFVDDPTEDPRIKRFRAKSRERERVKAKNSKNGEKISIDSMVESICCMGIGITPLTIGEMSYCAINKIFRRYQEKERYDIDMKVLTSGFSSGKTQPKNWIRDLND